jgi:hypothetical protein
MFKIHHKKYIFQLIVLLYSNIIFLFYNKMSKQLPFELWHYEIFRQLSKYEALDDLINKPYIKL